MGLFSIFKKTKINNYIDDLRKINALKKAAEGKKK